MTATCLTLLISAAFADNFIEGRPDLTADNTKMSDRTQLKGRRLVTLMSEPYPVPKVSATSAQAAYAAVLAGISL